MTTPDSLVHQSSVDAFMQSRHELSHLLQEEAAAQRQCGVLVAPRGTLDAVSMPSERKAALARLSELSLLADTQYAFVCQAYSSLGAAEKDLVSAPPARNCLI